MQGLFWHLVTLIMKLFLKIKHWQLFAILFAIPVIIMFSLPEEVILDNSPENIKVSVVIMGIYLAILLSWIWTLGVNLYKRVPATTNIKTGFALFIFCLCVIIAYIILIFWTIISFSNKIEIPAFLFPTLVWGYLITQVGI